MTSASVVGEIYPEVKRRITQVWRLSLITSVLFLAVCIIQLQSLSERVLASRFVVSDDFENFGTTIDPAARSVFGILIFFAVIIPFCAYSGTRNKDKNMLQWFCRINSVCLVVAIYSFIQIIYLGDFCSEEFTQQGGSCAFLRFAFYITIFLLLILMFFFIASAYASRKLYTHPKLNIIIVQKPRALSNEFVQSHIQPRIVSNEFTRDANSGAGMNNHHNNTPATMRDKSSNDVVLIPETVNVNSIPFATPIGS